MCQVKENEILLFVGKNDLNQSENLETSNIFISLLFHTYMKINQIDPTNKLTASMHPNSYNPVVAFL